MNTTIEFCIFKSVYISDSSLNWQFFFLTKLAQQSISGQKLKKWTSLMNSAYLN